MSLPDNYACKTMKKKKRKKKKEKKSSHLK